MTLSAEDVKALKSLGVRKKIIEEVFPASSPQTLEPSLIQKLKQAQPHTHPQLSIEYAWQLQILMRTKTLNPPDLEWLEIKDNLGAGIIHYLAWSGDVETALALCADNKLLESKTSTGLTIAHYAAWSGNAEQLDKLLTKKPELAKAETNCGLTIAHYAALSGNSAVLECVKKFYPESLVKWSGLGETVSHFAAWSGNLEALHWVKKNTPLWFDNVDIYNNGVTNYAMLSGSELQFETALSLSTVWFFYVGILLPKSEQLQFLGEYLKSHNDLLSIHPASVQIYFDEQEYSFIKQILSKNCAAHSQAVEDFLLQNAKACTLIASPNLEAIRKKPLFDKIIELGKQQRLSPGEQRKLWQQCLDPLTELGKRFWNKEGVVQCRKTKGTLGLISQEIVKIDEGIALEAKSEPHDKKPGFAFFDKARARATQYILLQPVESSLQKQKNPSSLPNLFKASKTYQEQASGTFYTNDSL